MKTREGPATRVAGAVRRRGLGGAARAAVREIRARLTCSYPWARAFHAHRRFRFDGADHRYFLHRYNSTWKTERVVEVPIVTAALLAHGGRRVLEVGNVLAHYGPVGHDRVDKYERGPGVLNVDVVEYAAAPYDLIVSISTLEHVGFDEEPEEPEKILRAIEHLRGLLDLGGSLLATLPLGYNPHLDAYLREGRLPFARARCLKRVSADNQWQEVPFDEVKDARLHAPFRGINGLVIGWFSPRPAG